MAMSPYTPISSNLTQGEGGKEKGGREKKAESWCRDDITVSLGLKLYPEGPGLQDRLNGNTPHEKRALS